MAATRGVLAFLQQALANSSLTVTSTEEGVLINEAFYRLAESGIQIAANGEVSFRVLHANTLTIDAFAPTGTPWFDVTAFGLVGDGSTNNDTAFAAMMTEVPDGGATIYFPHGNYKFSANILNFSN